MRKKRKGERLSLENGGGKGRARATGAQSMIFKKMLAGRMGDEGWADERCPILALWSFVPWLGTRGGSDMGKPRKWAINIANRRGHPGWLQADVV